MSLIRPKRIGSGTQMKGFASDRSMGSPFHVTGSKAKDVGINADKWPEDGSGSLGEFFKNCFKFLNETRSPAESEARGGNIWEFEKRGMRFKVVIQVM